MGTFFIHSLADNCVPLYLPLITFYLRRCFPEEYDVLCYFIQDVFPFHFWSASTAAFFYFLFYFNIRSYSQIWRLFSHTWVIITALWNDNFMSFIGDLEFCFGFVTEGFGPLCLVEFSTWRLLPRSRVGVFAEIALQHVSKKVWPLVVSSFHFLWGVVSGEILPHQPKIEMRILTLPPAVHTKKRSVSQKQKTSQILTKI